MHFLFLRHIFGTRGHQYSSLEDRQSCESLTRNLENVLLSIKARAGSNHKQINDYYCNIPV